MPALRRLINGTPTHFHLSRSQYDELLESIDLLEPRITPFSGPDIIVLADQETEIATGGGGSEPYEYLLNVVVGVEATTNSYNALFTLKKNGIAQFSVNNTGSRVGGGSYITSFFNAFFITVDSVTDIISLSITTSHPITVKTTTGLSFISAERCQLQVSGGVFP